MYIIEKTWSFAAAHHLPQLPDGHKCKRPHGHNYTVTLRLGSDKLDQFGFVIDYGDLGVFGDYVRDTFDHQDLNQVLDGVPTAENLARFFFFRAEMLLEFSPSVRVLACRVSETPATMAEYRP